MEGHLEAENNTLLRQCCPGAFRGQQVRQLVQVFSMIQPKLHMTEIFETGLGDSQALYSFRGVVCYSGMHYVALFWCPARKHWVLFDDTCIQEKEDWSSAVRILLSGQFAPTLIFYEVTPDGTPLAESLDELGQQVCELEDHSACVAM